MTDQITTEQSITEAFWAQRDIDAKLVAAMLRETAAKIDEIRQTDFYRDGLPVSMQNAAQTVTALANQLDHPVMPVLPVPMPMVTSV
jgi:hypothetical protein